MAKARTEIKSPAISQALVINRRAAINRVSGTNRDRAGKAAKVKVVVRPVLARAAALKAKVGRVPVAKVRIARQDRWVKAADKVKAAKV